MNYSEILFHAQKLIEAGEAALDNPDNAAVCYYQAMGVLGLMSNKTLCMADSHSYFALAARLRKLKKTAGVRVPPVPPEKPGQ